MKSLLKIIPVLSLVFACNLDAHAKPHHTEKAAASHQDNLNSPLGYWKTEEGKAKVHVYTCGENICGKIVALKEPNDPQTGKSKADPKGVPMINMEIMKGFKKENETHWKDGEIYDPKEGKMYSAELTLAEEGKKIELRGYVLVTLFGRTQTWERIGEKDHL